jgi:hypothetical protein
MTNGQHHEHQFRRTSAVIRSVWFQRIDSKTFKVYTFLSISQKQETAALLSEVRNSLLSESFQFLVLGTVIETAIAETSAHFPSVREQLSFDGFARKFFVNNSGIEAPDIRSLQLLLSGERISVRRSHGFLSNLFGNVNIERTFLNCSKWDRTNLSELMNPFCRNTGQFTFE